MWWYIEGCSLLGTEKVTEGVCQTILASFFSEGDNRPDIVARQLSYRGYCAANVAERK